MLVPYARISGARKRGTHGEGTGGMGWGGAGWGRAACARDSCLRRACLGGRRACSCAGRTPATPTLRQGCTSPSRHAPLCHTYIHTYIDRFSRGWPHPNAPTEGRDAREGRSNPNRTAVRLCTERPPRNAGAAARAGGLGCGTWHGASNNVAIGIDRPRGLQRAVAVQPYAVRCCRPEPARLVSPLPVASAG